MFYLDIMPGISPSYVLSLVFLLTHMVHVIWVHVPESGLLVDTYGTCYLGTCFWVWPSCWHIWYMLFGYMFLSLAFLLTHMIHVIWVHVPESGLLVDTYGTCYLGTCFWVWPSCWHIWYMLFGYMFLKLFFISSILVLVLNRVLALWQVILSKYSGRCPGLHEFTPCSKYFTFDLSILMFFHFLLNESFCPFIYSSFYRCPFSRVSLSFCSVHRCFMLVFIIRSVWLEGFLIKLTTYILQIHMIR